MARIIALSENMKPHIRRVSRNGKVQRAFAEQIGRPAGACVRDGVHAGMSRTAIRKVVRDCGKNFTGTKLNLG